MEYQCPDCPYVYNEEAGDPDREIVKMIDSAKSYWENKS